jgi:serine/threonine protein kinase
MDTKQVIARFEAERQALAMMDHPNIATVLGAGATETGRPYFVMELVKGIPITEYCQKTKLSTRQRLDLFMQVCDAVQHAHQKGVIHRDIKPSNVLVTLHDTRPIPKVIDFGIAKATSHPLTEKTVFTDFHYFIGTPEYMSPDQAEISGLDVDTRTDIYSLGVLLYELLTGTTPFDPLTLRKAAYVEIQRIIKEVEPPKPSTRIVTLAKEGTDFARLGTSEPHSLSRVMRGDLDWIVMKAMEKDRTRRYQSASEFSSDIQRYMKGEPVIAGPPSVSYKFRKFVLRHRLGVIATGLIAAALVVGLSLATAGFVQARREANRSQQIADFLQDMLVSTDPEHAVAEETDVESVLVTARQVFGEDHATVAATLSSRALQLQSSGDLAAAEELYRESIRIRRAQYGARVTCCEPLAALAQILSNQGRLDEAEALMREAVEIRKTHAPGQRLQLALTVHGLANMMSLAGRTEEVIDVLPELIETWRDALPPKSVFLARILTEIGAFWVMQDRPDEAEAVLREATEIFRGENQPGPLYPVAIKLLFSVFEDRGAVAEAIPIAIEAVELGPDTAAEGVWDFDGAVKNLGNLAWKIAAEPGLGENEYRVALRAIERALAEKPESPAFINTLGVLRYRLGEDEVALETLAVSHAYYSQQYEGGVPADLAFMALAHHELGHESEARQAMAALRAAMKNRELAESEDNQRHLAEAEAILGGETADESEAGQ